MKKHQIQELIRCIVKEILNEYLTQDQKEAEDAASITGGSDVAATDYEKRKQAHDQEVQRRKNIRTAELDMKNTKKQTDYFKGQAKQNDQKVQAQQKSLQNLKAGKDISQGGAGSINP